MSDSLRIGVIGAGVMGAGIAQSTAVGGVETLCYDISTDALSAARKEVTEGRFGVESAVARGKLDREAADAALARLRFTERFEEAVDVDVVVECVPENLELKLRVFRDLDRAAPPNAILASNSSGFPLAALAGATERPSRVIVWHWASPAPVMKLAEIVVNDVTDEAVTRTICELAERCGKNPVVIRDQPTAWGYVANRIYGAMLREASQVEREGVATKEQINQLMVDCFRWPTGPFAMVQGATSGWKKS
jgi:3-hydroxyacyl-CoA dehydrogenase